MQNKIWEISILVPEILSLPFYLKFDLPSKNKIIIKTLFVIPKMFANIWSIIIRITAKPLKASTQCIRITNMESKYLKRYK